MIECRLLCTTISTSYTWPKRMNKIDRKHDENIEVLAAKFAICSDIIFYRGCCTVCCSVTCFDHVSMMTMMSWWCDDDSDDSDNNDGYKGKEKWACDTIIIKYVHITMTRMWSCRVGYWTYSNSRSSKVMDLDANRKRICNFLLGLFISIVTLVVFRIVFEISTHKARK